MAGQLRTRVGGRLDLRQPLAIRRETYAASHETIGHDGGFNEFWSSSVDRDLHDPIGHIVRIVERLSVRRADWQFVILPGSELLRVGSVRVYAPNAESFFTFATKSTEENWSA